mmetsp:Transcript_43162/g.68224  ORF Transcript_43162/g.68224 Transcript_43162/m.68224 type:complete len:88 (-) Transcript_43162:29-292(-)
MHCIAILAIRHEAECEHIELSISVLKPETNADGARLFPAVRLARRRSRTSLNCGPKCVGTTHAMSQCWVCRVSDGFESELISNRWLP